SPSSPSGPQCVQSQAAHPRDWRKRLQKAKRKEEYETRIKHALAVLNEVSTDNTTHRNIRRAAKGAMDALQAHGHTIGLRASTAISTLDEISQDPNMPPYTRDNLWNV